MAKEQENPAVVEEKLPIEEQPQVTAEVSADDYREVVKKLIAQGAKQFKNIKIKNVTLTDMGNYIRVGLTLVPEVPAYNSNDEEVTSNVIFTSLFAVVAVIKQNEELSWAANVLLNQPKLLNMILCGSTIDIIQRRYEANVEIHNPYSKNPNSVPNVYDHRTIISDITEIRLGKVPVKMLDKIANRMIDSVISEIE